MLRERLIFVGTCDLSGHFRGKAFPAADLEARQRKGVGWTHSNLMMSAFGPIFETPFGTGGDLMIVPDPAAEVCVDFQDGSAVEHFFVGDLRNTDASPWECCPREFLRRGHAAVEAAAGLQVIAAFEQEFVYSGNEDRPGDPYSLGSFRRQGIFGEAFTAALRKAGVSPDSFLPEYGNRQFEVTVSPKAALTAADHAVITREMARATAHRLGHRAIFSPILSAEGVGNGNHIHFSFRHMSGEPATYDPDGAFGLTPAAAHFAAGVLHNLPSIAAITAPCPISYLRLTPNRWAPTMVDLVQQDRGAALRVCPLFAPANDAEAHRQFNLEFRVTDGATSPYMALGALLFAGADGIRRELPLPDPTTGTASLPRSLGDALSEMEGSETVRDWFGPGFFGAYLQHKRAEVAHTKDMAVAELCQRYAEIY